MEKFGIIFALSLYMLFMTAQVSMEFVEDDLELQETGWFGELCVLFLLTKVICQLAIWGRGMLPDDVRSEVS